MTSSLLSIPAAGSGAPGTVFIPSGGHTPARRKNGRPGKAVYDEFEAVKKDGITAQELEKARIQFLRGEIQGRSNDLNLANRIGFLAVYYNDPNLINTTYEKIAA